MLMTDQEIQVRVPKAQGDIATRPPLPPFTRETAVQKVRLAEDGWESERKYHWPLGRRPDAHPGLSDLSL